MVFHMKPEIALLLVVPLILAGCVTYRPLRLDDRVTLASSVSHLTVDTKSLPLGLLPPHPFDLSDGLDMTEVAILAVANNPILKLARDDAGIAHAQAFAAGLLPDPQVSLSRDLPDSSANQSAFSAALGYDLGSLVTRAARSRAARFESQKTDLNLLWQEWQVVAQARLLFSRSIAQQQLLRWLTENRDLLAERYAKVKAALGEGNYTRDSLYTTLLAWQDASRQLNDLERLQLQTRNDLNALLGLTPEAELRLVPEQVPAVPDEQQAERDLAKLSDRRPDLLALRAGYEAQDARYRQAILGQFPAFGLAFTRARDTSAVYTHGFALSLVLPVLNGNRGNIAVESATRQRVHDEYQIRLNFAYAEVKRLIVDNRLIAAQLEAAEAGMQVMDQTSENAARALKEGLMEVNGYTLLQSSRIAKHIEVTGLQQALLENRIALLVLLGGDLEAKKMSGEQPHEQ